MPPLVDHDIVCVSVMDWEHPFQSSRHHLMRALARHNRVLFVDNQFNPVNVLRGLRQAPMRRKLATWAGLAQNPREVEPNVWVYNPPPVLPMGKLTDPAVFNRIYALNQRGLVKGVQGACKALGFERPVLWISFNVLSSEGLIGHLDEQLVIYHCTDEITAMSGTSCFAGEIERRLLAKSDLVFTSSRQLLADKGPFNPNSHFVPNGADTELFERALDPLLAPHPVLEGLAGPVIGFAGHMEDRFDFDLIAAVAAAHPAWSIALAGPIAPAQQAQADRLASQPNVRFCGLLPREELPAFLKGVDVALIPFVHSRQTRAIYPLKLNEYLAAGKPVALTPFADLREFDGLVAVGDGPEAFAAAIADALQDTPERRAARVALARANNWDGRMAHMAGLIGHTLEGRQAA
ncbi:MAG: UDP-glycosyl transferase/glycogen phosphorylase [Cyanobacteria bacterium RYN_339]|nr:UDP-glycosyl transferase/glycogen phosphorylase [Cyanobacteria bacterium RYN_339]